MNVLAFYHYKIMNLEEIINFYNVMHVHRIQLLYKIDRETCKSNVHAHYIVIKDFPNLFLL